MLPRHCNPNALFNKVQLEMEQLKINPTQQTPSICRDDVSHQTKFRMYILSLRDKYQIGTEVTYQGLYIKF